MNGPIKAKVTPRAEFDRSRPPSPLKRLPTSPSPTPGPRPRAKVNTSAQIGARKVVGSPPTQNLTSTTRANISVPRAPLARAPSPFKPTQAFTTYSSVNPPQIKAKVSSTARSNVTATSSAPSVPELRHRALTSAETSTLGQRARKGSLSSHVSSSSGVARSAFSPPRVAITTSNEENEGSVRGAGLRIKSKVTRLADQTSQIPKSLPPSPSFSQSRPARVPSISNLSLSPPLVAAPGPRSAPISPPPGQFGGTARYATTREGPRAHQYQPFTSRDVQPISHPVFGSAKIDPAHVPLPPQSPPGSTLSFSSRSSARSSVSCETRSSDSTGSTAPTNLLARVNGNGFGNGSKHSRASSVDGLGVPCSPLSREPSRDNQSPAPDSDDEHDDIHDTPEEDDDRKLRNQAKSIRKIADLEITNRSLLAINSQLEAAKSRQAKEIRELRRKLRESILILPPPAYRAAKSSLKEANTQIEEDDEDEDEDEVDEPVVDGALDEGYGRVKSLIEVLLESGRKALESKPEDFTSAGTSVTKVLSEEEARTWRGEDPDTRSLLDDDASSYHATEDGASRPLTPSRIAIPGDDLDSEDEVEASLIIDERDLADIPPITVTPSPSH